MSQLNVSSLTSLTTALSTLLSQDWTVTGLMRNLLSFLAITEAVYSVVLVENVLYTHVDNFGFICHYYQIYTADNSAAQDNGIVFVCDVQHQH